MANQKRGRQSFLLPDPPVITHWASVAGKKESEGPLAHTFDIKSQDTYFGQKTWEQGEKQMQKLALGKLAEKANMKLEDFDLVFSGDLLNQCIGSSFTLRNLGIPHLGLYGACSTMAESLLLSSMAVGGGYDWSQSNWDRRKLLSYTEEDAERDGYTFIDDINDSDGIYDYNNGDGYDY